MRLTDLVGCWPGLINKELAETMNTRQTIAKYVLGTLTKRDMVSFAEESVLNGSDSESMILLAYESEEAYYVDISTLFERAIRESGIHLPNNEQAAEDRFKYWLEAIVNGEISPHEGAKSIYEEVYSIIKANNNESYVGECLDIGKIVGAMYEYDDLQEPYIMYEGKTITKAEADAILNDIVISEAKRLLTKNIPTIA